MLWSFPGLVGLVLLLAGSVPAGDWIKQRREAGRPLPPADSPNVLLIVLDTVRADHLSLYGYHRATTPKLEQLAKRGIRFEQCAGHRAVDPPFAREHVHGPLAPRARCGMDDPAARRSSPRWPNTWDLMAMRPRVSPLIRSSVRMTPASTGASLITRITKLGLA